MDCRREGAAFLPLPPPPRKVRERGGEEKGAGSEGERRRSRVGERQTRGPFRWPLSGDLVTAVGGKKCPKSEAVSETPKEEKNRPHTWNPRWLRRFL